MRRRGENGETTGIGKHIDKHKERHKKGSWEEAK